MGLFSKLTSMMINNTDIQPALGLDTSLVPYFLIFYLVFIGILFVASYIYIALAYSRLAKKTHTSPSWLAWIPIANVFLITKMARMHWWPMLLAIPLLIVIPAFFISKILFVIILVIAILCAIALCVFTYIWNWKIFERVGKPGWWVLLSLIPYAGGIIFFVFLGIAAWSDKKYN